MVMESEQIAGPGDRSKTMPNKVPRGAQLREELARISTLIDQLESAMTGLPYVEETGSSECPWAEDLYAQKEELEKELTFEVTKLQYYLPELEKRVSRCEKNLQCIETDSATLTTEQTKECYSEALEAQRKQYREAVQDRDAVFIVLAKAEAVLAVSRTRKYPGKMPERQSPPLGATPSSSQSSGRQSHSGGPDGEITGLMSLGPLG